MEDTVLNKIMPTGSIFKVRLRVMLSTVLYVKVLVFNLWMYFIKQFYGFRYLKIYKGAVIALILN
jgi:hypothetical protein